MPALLRWLRKRNHWRNFKWVSVQFVTVFEFIHSLAMWRTRRRTPNGNKSHTKKNIIKMRIFCPSSVRVLAADIRYSRFWFNFQQIDSEKTRARNSHLFPLSLSLCLLLTRLHMTHFQWWNIFFSSNFFYCFASPFWINNAKRKIIEAQNHRFIRWKIYLYLLLAWNIET